MFVDSYNTLIIAPKQNVHLGKLIHVIPPPRKCYNVFRKQTGIVDPWV